MKNYSDAKKARVIQNIIGHPSTDDYIDYLQKNLIPNCSITKGDILRAEDILGPNSGSLKGKTTKNILADGQFESTRKHIEALGIMLNVTGRDEHVPEIERYIRTVKERVHAIVNTLPFKSYPHRLIVETVNNAIFWLNCFPNKNGVHATLSPRAIITGSHIYY